MPRKVPVFLNVPDFPDDDDDDIDYDYPTSDEDEEEEVSHDSIIRHGFIFFFFYTQRPNYYNLIF